MMMRSPADTAKLADGPEVEDVITLLSSPKTKLLLSGYGHKVSVSELEGKVVGLYFYSGPSCDEVIFELKYMYRKLKNRGENFELVFVCLHRKLSKDTCNTEVIKTLVKHREEKIEKNFMKHFQGLPWLAVPFSYRKSNGELYELLNMLSLNSYGVELVIIRPGENIAHTHAMDIYRDYGIEAYPFAKSTLTEIEVARLKSLTLDDVLFSGRDDKFVIAKDGRKVPASDLVGKNILIFLITQPVDKDDCSQHKRTYKKVTAWYNEIKQKDEAFEMIRIFHDYDQSYSHLVQAGERYNRKKPWLEFPYDKYDMDALYDKLLKVVSDFDSSLPMFVAFGRDGRFLTMKSLDDLINFDKDDDDSPSPDFFNDVNLYGEVRDYIANSKDWSSVDEETGELYYP